MVGIANDVNHNNALACYNEREIDNSFQISKSVNFYIFFPEW